MKKLEEWVKQSKPARLKPPHNVIKLLNNGFRPATYRCFGSIKRRKGWIFVIEGGTIITLHKHDSGEWELEGEGN